MLSTDKIYLTKRNNGIYYAGQKINGRIRWRTTKATTKSDAFLFIKTFDIKAEDKAVVPTLSQYLTVVLLQANNLREQTVGIYNRALKSFIQVLGDKPLNEYTVTDIEKFKSFHVERGISPHTVNIFFRVGKALFNKAIRQDIIQTNPFSKSESIKVQYKSPQYLSKDELRKIISFAKTKMLKDIILFAAFTGMRISEILNLQWKVVDLEKKQLVVSNSDDFVTKSGRERIIPLNDTVVEILSARFDAGRKYVFGKLNDTILSRIYVSHQFKNCVRKARMSEEIHFHTLRSTFAVLCLSTGTDIFTVSKLLGHSGVQVTQQHYASVMPNLLHEAVQRMKI
ncbi:MAG: tyrosine-type recombinase/integrase [Bacteroidota bacterium]